MELNNNDAAVRIDATNARAETTTSGEIDLYDELIAFAELSPEEQRLTASPEKAPAETEGMSAGQAEETPTPEPVLTPAPVEPVEEAARSQKQAEETACPEAVLIQAPLEPVEEERTVPAAEESASDTQASNAYVEQSEVNRPLVEGPRPSGPLSCFSLTPDFVFTGALTRGVCLACGGESGAADDLFCMTCGVFVDEIASAPAFNPTCLECKQGITADEIFCPWCGSVLLAA